MTLPNPHRGLISLFLFGASVAWLMWGFASAAASPSVLVKAPLWGEPIPRALLNVAMGFIFSGATLILFLINLKLGGKHLGAR